MADTAPAPTPPPKPAVAIYCSGFANYTKLLTEDKPKEAGTAAYALGLTPKNSPYNLKGSPKEARDPRRDQLWNLGWNEAKAAAEATAATPTTAPPLAAG